MKLKDLEAQFAKYIHPDAGEHPRGGSRYVDSLSEADGIWFLCPKCFAKNNGRIGTHMVCCWFVGKVPDEAVPGPGRWNPSGTGYADLTFVGPGACSVQLIGGCGWHGCVRSGEVS
jgi:hypothetical protein